MKKVHLFLIFLYLILMLIGAFTRLKAEPLRTETVAFDSAQHDR
jgi:hypothetical protein